MLDNYPPGVTGNEPEIAGGLEPVEGMAVCEINKRGKYCTGEITRIHDDGTVTFFTVAWDGGWSVEYPMRYWGDRVSPVSCKFCDSPYHRSSDEGECRSHFA